jgi:hypothetical protein
MVGIGNLELLGASHFQWCEWEAELFDEYLRRLQMITNEACVSSECTELYRPLRRERIWCPCSRRRPRPPPWPQRWGRCAPALVIARCKYQCENHLRSEVTRTETGQQHRCCSIWGRFCYNILGWSTRLLLSRPQSSQSMIPVMQRLCAHNIQPMLQTDQDGISKQGRIGFGTSFDSVSFTCGNNLSRRLERTISKICKIFCLWCCWLCIHNCDFFLSDLMAKYRFWAASTGWSTSRRKSGLQSLYCLMDHLLR